MFVPEERTHMKKNFERFLSIALCVVLMANFMVIHVHAADTAGDCSDGSHNWVLQDVHAGVVCPLAQVGQIRCTKCGAERGQTLDEHSWSNWNITAAASCDTPGSQYRTCTRGCGATDTQPIAPTGHKWMKVTVQVTCEKPGYTVDKCSVCGTEQNRVDVPAKGHYYVDDGNCTTAPRCANCGALKPGSYPAQHKFGGKYFYNNDSHWQKCQNEGCEVTSTPAAHKTTNGQGDCTKGTTCTVCGDTTVAGQQHNFTNGRVSITIAGGHYVSCTNPGCSVTQLVPHTAGTVSSCTDTVRCTVCNYAISTGKAHVLGAVTQGDSLGHERKCQNCDYVEKSSHVGENDDSNCLTPVKCTTCGYVLVGGYAGHDYSSTVWTNDGASGHSTQCVHPGCQYRSTGAHTGGTATCRSLAVCTVCGGSYGSKNTNNHDGGTELRNVKAAAVGQSGYTGDTYCLGCNQKIATGSTIPALAPDHTHSYAATWKKDSANHWHECACGNRKDVAPHSFVDGKCTICGEADPNYKPVEEHIHTYRTSWYVNSKEHWHECSVCGHQADRDIHRFLNNVCIECGMTFAQYQQEEKRVGSLTVRMTVAGQDADPELTFAFTVTLYEDETMETVFTDLTGTYGDMVFTDGVATFELKHGQSVTATDLPAGLTYKVTEAENEDYTVTSFDAKDTILENETREVSFVNTWVDDTVEEEEPTVTEPSVETLPTETEPPVEDIPEPANDQQPGLWPALVVLAAAGLAAVIWLGLRKRRKK